MRKLFTSFGAVVSSVLLIASAIAFYPVSSDYEMHAPTETSALASSPSRTVSYLWYDMFNISPQLWMQQRQEVYNDQYVYNDSYPYVYVWKLQPPGRELYSTSARLKVTARNLPELNTIDRPVFVPFFGSERGGTMEIDWYITYLTSEDYPNYPNGIENNDDGWITKLTGNVTLDEQAAKAMLNMTSEDFNDYVTWWNNHKADVVVDISHWFDEQAHFAGPFPIYSSFGSGLLPLYLNLTSEMVGNEIVIHYDYCSWGFGTLMAKWLVYAFMPTERWYFDMAFHAVIGPETADVDIDTVVEYALRAWREVGDNEPCWLWQGELQESITAISYPSKLKKYLGRPSPLDRFYGVEYFWDYTPWAFNLSSGESLEFEWPSSPMLFIEYLGPGMFANHTANMTVSYSEPMESDLGENLTGNVIVDHGGHTLRFIGPMDVWHWSKNQTQHSYLKYRWDQVQLLPYGIPYIEFSMAGNNTPPIASFTVDPTSGNESTMFDFNASSSSDHEDDAEELLVRWDYDGDGYWDTDWSFGKGSEWMYLTGGSFDATLQVKDSNNLTCIAVEHIVVAVTVIPEFSTVIVPVLLLVGVVGLALFCRRRT